MAKNDDGFNLDDMMEIFGESIEAPAKKEEPARPAPAPVATVEKPAPTHDQLSDEEMAVLAAYEKQKKEQKAKEEEARRQKDEDARKILESYEKELQAAREREAKLRRELEEKQKQELEALKKKQEVAAINKEEEERKIIEEFERQAREQKEKDEAARRQKEEQAQAELQALAQKQKAEEAARQAEAAKHEEEIRAKAAAATASSSGDKKESRLMELLAKAQKDIEAAAPAPLPGASTGSAQAQAPSSAAAGAAGSARDILIDVEQKENDAFNYMLDETRKTMFTFLAPMIGIKAATNMLNKTVEKARTKGPVVLKDANWKIDGSLREDGSIDPDRILANVQKVPVATRVDDFLTAFHALVNLRINAVEQGLGAKTGADLRMKLAELRRPYKDKGLRPDWIDLFFSHVIG